MSKLLTIQEAADKLGISTRKLWELGNRGEIPLVRIDRSVRYPDDQLDAYIESKTRRPAKARA